MSHTSVMLIHENDEGSIMSKYYFDAEEEDGAEMEFQEEMSAEDAKDDYEENADKTKHENVSDYMNSEYGYILNDDKTYYGYKSNCLGKYDWYEVGGRWSNLLPYGNLKKIKKLYKDTLGMKNEEGIKLFRNDIDFFSKVSEMSFEDGCIAMDIGGCDSIKISKDITAEAIIERFKAVYKAQGQHVGDDVFSTVIYDSIMLEEDGEESSFESSSECFIELYNRLLERNIKEGRDFKVTILDLHS